MTLCATAMTLCARAMTSVRETWRRRSWASRRTYAEGRPSRRGAAEQAAGLPSQRLASVPEPQYDAALVRLAPLSLLPRSVLGLAKEIGRHILRRPVVGIAVAAHTADGRWLLIRRADTGT